MGARQAQAKQNTSISDIFHSGTDRKGRNRVGVLPYLQDGGGFNDQAAPRKKNLRVQRPHHGNVKWRKYCRGAKSER